MQWKNLSLFLAAFGGACVQEVHNPSALISVVPVKYLPDEMRVLQNPTTMVTTFIRDLTDLLISDTLEIREIARDALGCELSPRLYGKLFQHIEELVTVRTLVYRSLIFPVHSVIHSVTSGAEDELPETFGIFLDQVSLHLIPSVQIYNTYAGSSLSS